MDCKTESMGSMYCVLGTRVCKHITRVFWPGVPSIVLAVKQTTTCPQAGVCAPFSFAKTELLVLVLRNCFFRKHDTFF